MSSVVEWCALHELVHDLCALGPPHVDLHEAVAGLLRGAVLVVAPAGVREAQVAASAKTCDPPGAVLLGRAVGVVDADAALGSGLHDGEAVQAVHEALGMASWSWTCAFLYLPLHECLPRAGGPRHWHASSPSTLRWCWACSSRMGDSQAHASPGARSSCSTKTSSKLARARGKALPRSNYMAETNDVLWQNLIRLRDDIVLLVRHPDVVAILVRRCRRLVAQAQPTNEHVPATVAVPLGHRWVLCEVLACAEDLPGTATSIEASLRDGQDTVGTRPVEALELIGLPAQLGLQILATLVVEVGEQRVVHDPSGL
eukprot:CAMPEP_0203857290 /NCGR_PEP_ID=MMETSP0359-20131031/10648_1 /ASSEMBLY_ACC=CAM_ASM_000338 /TAXON_ID=268821 /ORGANISM="Scrippsiella Hangoei, Strain SHTV-5" /LENGTH=313 /DNA_ID=CAMNT_0050773975 /DNA_START=11 /DNA_END=950 /DNA_ORIENTATION=+